MCRICGIYNPAEKNLEQRVRLMRDTMQRGGPDDAGLFVHDQWPLALGHRRLSLIDLSVNGHQPMRDDVNGLIIVFNGEIYNYDELKNTLQQYGHTFRTHTDTEVILKAYAQWGLNAFELFNGMFAFAIWDERKGQIILARDHAGMKPLYYAFQNGTFSFASEIRAFACTGLTFQENEDWPVSFLAFGHLPEPVTTLKEVIPLQKGTALVVDIPSLSFRTHTFFSLQFKEELIHEDDAIDLLKVTLTKAVKRHMISDAPLGLFLSGGIDSS
jgi:asparagine synthase (glutamine-hydrolysing)